VIDLGGMRANAVMEQIDLVGEGVIRALADRRS
jgi:hypothetical protein